MGVCFTWFIFIEEGTLRSMLLEVNIGCKSAALNLSVLIVILSKHLGKGLTHRSKCVRENAEKVG